VFWKKSKTSFVWYIYMYHSKFAQVSMDKVCKMHSVQKLWKSLKCSWKGKREGILPLKYANFNLCWILRYFHKKLCLGNYRYRRFWLSKYMCTELKTLDWDILNPDYLIWVSNGHTFDFLLKPLFLGYCREKSKNRVY